MAYATGMTLASRCILPICSRTFLSSLRVASLLVFPEKPSSAFFRRVQVPHLFSTSTTPLFSSVKCSIQSTSSLETDNQAVSRHNVVDILEERGLLESITSENLRSACSDPNVAPLRVYCGFDPTAESLHLGNLLGIIGLTFPLLLKNDGTKFGKSEDGAIWLSPSMLSPYEFYQYFFSVPDVDVIRFLKTLTFLSLDEIKILEDQMSKPGYVPNTAQIKLGEEVTRFVHGEEGLKEAIKATEALRPGAETKLDWNLIERIAEDIPSCSMPIDQVSGLSIVDLSVSAGLFESKSAARRMLKQGGVYMNNERVDDENKRVEEEDIVEGKGLVLSAGKKNKVVVRVS